MKTVNEILGENQTLRGAVRVLTGKTNSGKRAIYISGNPPGLRLLADILRAQADAVGSGGGSRGTSLSLSGNPDHYSLPLTIRSIFSKFIATITTRRSTKLRA